MFFGHSFKAEDNVYNNIEAYNEEWAANLFPFSDRDSYQTAIAISALKVLPKQKKMTNAYSKRIQEQLKSPFYFQFGLV